MKRAGWRLILQQFARLRTPHSRGGRTRLCGRAANARSLQRRSRKRLSVRVVTGVVDAPQREELPIGHGIAHQAPGIKTLQPDGTAASATTTATVTTAATTSRHQKIRGEKFWNEIAVTLAGVRQSMANHGGRGRCALRGERGAR